MEDSQQALVSALTIDTMQRFPSALPSKLSVRDFTARPADE